MAINPNDPNTWSPDDRDNYLKQQAKGRTSGGPGNYGGHNGGPGGAVPGAATGAAFNGSPAYDLFNSSANFVINRLQPDQNYMTQYYIEQYNAIRCDLYINDLSGGMDAQVRTLREGLVSNEVAYSTLDTRFPRTVNLPPLLYSDATAANEIGTIEAMSACFLNDGGTSRWLAAAGDTANKALFALDDNAGTPRITAQTYTPSTNIVSLTTVKIVTNTERVMVGRAGGVAQILTGFNGTPTTSGSMHANTTQMWGAIVSSLNSVTLGANTILMYCNDGLYSLSTATAAIGDAPTAVLTNWPGGGYALGIATLSTEGVARAYWVHPLNDLSASMLDTGEPGRIVSTNLEGTDPKFLEMGLPFVKHALIWRGAPVATDGKQVHWNNGDIIDLGFNRERRWADGANFGFGTIMCLAVNDDRLFAAVATITGDANDVNSPAVWEEYIPETNSWHFVCYVETNPGLLPNLAAFTGETPVYQPHGSAIDNGIFFWYAKIGGGALAPTYTWHSIPLLATGVNAQWQQDDNAYIRYKFGTGGSVASPVYQVMGLPLFISDIWFGGYLSPGAQVNISVDSPAYPHQVFNSNAPTGIFKEGTDWRHQWWKNPDMETASSASMGHSFQFAILMAQGTVVSNVTKTSPSPLPFRIGFYIFLDGNYTSPKTMEPRRYWGPRV